MVKDGPRFIICSELGPIKETEGPIKGIISDYVSLYLMLAAFGIENILKGIILKNDPSADPKRLNKLFSGHDLKSLAKQADINCTPEESDLLKRLSIAAVQARYPIPRKWEQYRDGLDGSGKRPRVVFSKDMKRIVNFIDKLTQDLKGLGIDFDFYDLSCSHTKDEKTVHISKRFKLPQIP